MSGNRRNALLVSAALVGGALLMTACQDSDSGSAQGSSSATPADKTATPPGSSTTGGNQGGGQASGGKSSGGQGSAAGTGSGTGGKVGKCRTDELKITASDTTITGDTDGTVTVHLKNTGGHSCAISGYAGVDLKTTAGPLSAKRNGEKTNSIVLKSGQSTDFGIYYPINNSGGSGVRITGLLVTPPNETKTVSLRWPGGGSLPVTEGGGSAVKVGAIGNAGQGG
ncbi:DUF4232 domain-containing protein [Streptomyces sp. CBMA152]|uniref:DUF4232 domain-containing protein n=1 Tax=Streptomyces sp. CBMA152 TaxID=1896312 RepID=UPI001660C0A5|nr:DUF4232 domain-containing protein [Streptomyces sp. CBMA152]MBD0741412.1 hypothetical protein [Streptomyces sp. CBMA152]